MKEHLRAEDCAKILGIKRDNFIRNIASRPDFPAKIRINRTNYWWWKSDFEQWIEAQKVRKSGRL